MFLIKTMLSWLKQQKVSISWRCNWPDASDEKCKKCDTIRREHRLKAHAFDEGV